MNMQRNGERQVVAALLSWRCNSVCRGLRQCPELGLARKQPCSMTTDCEARAMLSRCTLFLCASNFTITVTLHELCAASHRSSRHYL
jgi:hypothetical protein